jgi:RNA-directed DNA polymerase
VDGANDRFRPQTRDPIGRNAASARHPIRRFNDAGLRQWQNGHNRFNELRRRGVPKVSAAVAAGSPTGFWRMSGHPAVQQALRNHYFDSLGLPRLYFSVQAPG